MEKFKGEGQTRGAQSSLLMTFLHIYPEEREEGFSFLLGKMKYFPRSVGGEGGGFPGVNSNKSQGMPPRAETLAYFSQKNFQQSY